MSRVYLPHPRTGGEPARSPGLRWINRRPSRTAALFLAMLPFIAVVVLYAVASEVRLSANPADKLLPSFPTIADGIRRMAFSADPRTGDYLIWVDTVASLGRLVAGLTTATLLGLAAGMMLGLLPMARAALAPFVTVVSMVPPLALLPILFILLGLGETAKITLIAIGIAPFMIRDLAGRVEELPRELTVKAETLGGSSLQIALCVTLPQILPRLIDSVRLSLGPAWLFLIAAEAIASESGLGYRIFLVRRYLSMDVIVPYVAWITLIAFLMDLGLRRLQAKAFPWFAGRAG